jgi:hypothetical protein
VRDDKHILSKLTSYEHADTLTVDLKDWYEKTWSTWTPESKDPLRPQGKEKSVAKYQPAPKAELPDFLKFKNLNIQFRDENED